MSGETVSDALSALHLAVAATDSLLQESEGEQHHRALAGRAAMIELCNQLSRLEDQTVITAVDLEVPAAITWLPKAVQQILGSKTSLGQAIVAAARQATQGGGFGDQHLVRLADLNNAVRMRSSSPRFDLFSDSSRQRSPLPPSN